MGIRKEAWSDLLKRYLTVWRNVWAARKELEPPKRDRHERDFLPAHLELTETPVSPLPKWTARVWWYPLLTAPCLRLANTSCWLVR